MVRLLLIVLRLIVAFLLLTAYDGWAGLVAAIGFDGLGTVASVIHTTTLVAAVALGAKTIADLLDAVLWEWFVPRHYGRAAPSLIADLTRVLIWMIAIGYVLARLSTQAATGIIATSSVGVAVVGFALRSLIADLFAGIAISLERPFHLGDWLDLGANLRGKVLEVNWRSTHLEDIDRNLLVVPNSKLSEMVIRNTSRPATFFIDSLTVLLDYTVTSHQAERILLSAAGQVPDVARLSEKPKVRVAAHTERGVEWQLKFPVPDMGEASRLRYHVWRNILRNLHFAGINPPPQRYEMFDAERGLEPPNRAALNRAFLRRVDLFASLTAEELDLLYAQMESRLYLSGEMIVRQGDSGDSLFLLKDGLLNVLVADGAGNQRNVAQLQAGSFFGEMSLLTGAPRGASVVSAVDSQVFEIRRDTLRPIMQQREAIASHMSDVLASRQVANAKRMAEAQASAAAPPEHHSLAQQFLGRIRNLFGLAGAAA